MNTVLEKGIRAVEGDPRWQAIACRDRSADGDFVFAVRSTSVYCRPSCPARRPLISNVLFFSTPGEAEAAGFRECKRCQPRGLETSGHHAEMVESARHILEASSERMTLAELGDALGVSPGHLQRVFKRVTGVSPSEYAAACRATRLKSSLQAGDDVTGSLYSAGYGSGSRLYEAADGLLGMTPGSYRRGGEGETITYTIRACALGRLLIAATDRGICAASLGDNDELLEGELRREFRAASLVRDDTSLAGWAAAIASYIEAEGPAPEVPLDVNGTPFQQRVWQELETIPYGATVSYGEVAKRIGDPKAARAVAGACGANRIALLIPCHRVVSGSGDLGGYRWGTARKRFLLVKEAGANVVGRPARLAVGG